MSGSNTKSVTEANPTRIAAHSWTRTGRVRVCDRCKQKQFLISEHPLPATWTAVDKCNVAK